MNWTTKTFFEIRNNWKCAPLLSDQVGDRNFDIVKRNGCCRGAVPSLRLHPIVQVTKIKTKLLQLATCLYEIENICLNFLFLKKSKRCTECSARQVNSSESITERCPAGPSPRDCRYVLPWWRNPCSFRRRWTSLRRSLGSGRLVVSHKTISICEFAVTAQQNIWQPWNYKTVQNTLLFRDGADVSNVRSAAGFRDGQADFLLSRDDVSTHRVFHFLTARENDGVEADRVREQTSKDSATAAPAKMNLRNFKCSNV